MDPTYVCLDCAHQWCAPEHPERCENCLINATLLRRFDDPDEADECSEAVLARGRLTWQR